MMFTKRRIREYLYWTSFPNAAKCLWPARKRESEPEFQ